jgi:chloramphenicol 3-O-phosphotransferase
MRSALLAMEGSVQSTKASLAFAAPEMMDQFWAQLQMDLADTMFTLYDRYDKLLKVAAAALERTDVGDAEEATAILRAVVNLDGTAVEPEPKEDN